MLTLKLKYNTDNLNTINDFVYHYTKLFYKVYNNPELMEDRTFISEQLNSFIDKSIYDSCMIDVKTKLKQLETSIKNKEKLITEIKDELTNFETKDKKEKRRKFKLIKKLAYLERTIDKNICFGGKTLIRQINKIHSDIKNIKTFGETKNNKLNEKQELLSKYKNEFKEKRKLGVYLVGRACEHGNRKVDFDFVNNTLVFKPNKNNKIELKINTSKNQYNTLLQIQHLVDLKLIPLTVRIDNKYVYISYDEELLNGYSFDDNGCKKEQNLVFDKEYKKEIYKKYIKEQEERKLDGKLKDRYLAVDLNPYNIGLSIVDKINDNGDFKVILKENIDLSRLSTKLKVSSDSKKQTHQNNKRKHEIKEVWKYIFSLAKHYKVSHFVMEDLNFKPKTTEVKGKEFNRKTKNIWHRTLTVNLITKHCNVNGIIKIEVNPCYSSFIGNMIYSDYDAVSASLELNRRGIVRYIKGSSIYPCISRINQEKLDYLLGENIVLHGITWVKLYNELSLLRYRNLSKDKLIDRNLYSKQSKVLINY